jgi:NADP-dependent 3-hydroxy acid dehydrogenase YdfG
LLLQALEFAMQHSPFAPKSVACTFNNPVSVGDNAQFILAKGSESQLKIAVIVNELVCATVILDRNDSLPGRQSVPSALGEDKSAVAVPIDLPPSAHVGRSYRIGLQGRRGGGAFLSVAQHMSHDYVASLCALSYFVGMVCPGLHSIFSSLKVWTAGGALRDLSFSVLSYDERFQIFNIAVQGALLGEVRAFQRPPPAAQPSMNDVAPFVGTGEFLATRSVIVGGSRGLGELTAKLLASGGGDTVITDAHGREDASRVAAEIRDSGVGSCESVRFDVMDDSIEAIDIDLKSLDMLFYFATPRIYRKKARVFEEALFEEFVSIYVKRFFTLCEYLEANVNRRVAVYFPSSVFVDQRGAGFAEYGMAKVAAEALIADINRSFKRLTIYVTRLPRLSTDQTSALFSLEASSNVDTLLPILRAMHGLVKSGREH